MSALGKTRRGGAEMALSVESSGRVAIEAMPMHPGHARHLPPAAKERLLRAASAVDPGGLSALLRVTVDEASVATELEMITCPVLLVNGSRETAFQPLRQSLPSRLSNLRVVDLDGGHAVNLQCADDFNRSVIDFIRSL
jgi:pimeloyl-ACP methyl ester carboxylesterase